MKRLWVAGRSERSAKPTGWFIAVIFSIMALLPALPVAANISDATDVSLGELRSNILTNFDANRNGQIDSGEKYTAAVCSLSIACSTTARTRTAMAS